MNLPRKRARLVFGASNCLALPLLCLLLSPASAVQRRRPPAPIPSCRVPGPATVEFVGTAKYQWKGWGTSLCWFANFLGGLRSPEMNYFLDLLFTARGLNLNIVRYNIGGGFDPRHSPQFNTSTWVKYKVLPSFLPNASGVYDWSADARQRRVLLGAVVRGANQLVAFSNSPPWWMTDSGDVAGARYRGNDNLREKYYDAFAQYLVDVVEHYADAWHVRFQYLEPVNEPLDGWWRAGNSQEGCNFKASSLSKLYPRVAQALEQKNLSTALVGIDDWSLKTVAGLSSMSKTAVSTLSALHVHGYARSSVEVGWYSAVANTAQQLRKEVWVSEWGPMFTRKDEMSVALGLAMSVIRAVNYMGASAWTHWQAIDHKPEVPWSLIQFSWEDLRRPIRYHLPKAYFVLQQFTHYAPPGSVAMTPISSSDCRSGVVAFWSTFPMPSLSVFVVNQENLSRSISLKLSSFKGNLSSTVKVQVFRTSAKESHVQLPQFSASLDVALELEFKGMSVTTLKFSSSI